MIAFVAIPLNWGPTSRQPMDPTGFKLEKNFSLSLFGSSGILLSDL